MTRPATEHVSTKEAAMWYVGQRQSTSCLTARKTGDWADGGGDAAASDRSLTAV